MYPYLLLFWNGTQEAVTMVTFREGNEWLDDKDERLFFFTVCPLVSLNLVLMYTYYSKIETNFFKKKHSVLNAQ